jgi:thymidylate synthase (FAD)
MGSAFEQLTDSDLTTKMEIDDQGDEQYPTRRNTARALEDILGQKLQVLDHGFIRVIDYMGDDGAIVQAARVSYGKGTKKVSDDRGLIRYLLRHRHTTPFEMCEIKLHVKLPIFVARQWVRHRTANINEYSARYSVLDNQFYVPDPKYLESLQEEEFIQKKEDEGQRDLFGVQPAAVTHTAAQSTANKQGREHVLSHEETEEVLKIIKRHSEASYRRYVELLNEENGRKLDERKMGLARELARIVLPTNFYTQWYWKVDLHNLLRFLSLRADPHAQYEIRAYAERILDIVHKWVPVTARAFEDYIRGSVSLSSAGVAIVRRLVGGEKLDPLVNPPGSGLNKREWKELMQVLGLFPQPSAD